MTYAETLLQRFAPSGIVIDTNLRLLFAIGDYDEAIIARGSFKRLSAYSLEDLQLLRTILRFFSCFVTTPHILTEVSNWLGHLPQEQEIACLKRFSETFQPFLEIHRDATDLCRHEKFPYLGLTDTAVAELASQYLVVSDDARLVGHLNQLGLDALNINHIRQELWLRE